MDFYTIKNIEFTNFIKKNDFNSLLDNYVNIEKEINRQIEEICEKVLLDNGYSKKSHNTLTKNMSTVRIDTHYSSKERKLIIYILDLIDSSRKPSDKKVSSFGSILNLQLEINKKNAYLEDIVYDKVFAFLRFSYNHLEDVYLDNYDTWNKERKKHFTKGIYELINATIESRNLPKFKNKLFLAIVELDNKNGDTGKFTFNFNRDYVKILIGKFKKNSILTYSPFELISELIRKEVIDEQTSKYKEGIYTFQETLNDLEIRLEDNTYRFWLAERILYSEAANTAMGVNTIAAYDKYLLSVDHSAYNHIIAIGLVDTIKEEIEELFTNNIISYKESKFKKLAVTIYNKSSEKIIILKDKVVDIGQKEMTKEGLKWVWEKIIEIIPSHI